ncbi:hypothetical protein M569_12503 [Genlisea aurea]|uniref:Uncharacterized protein n=1 Tax=Genlisea aurea TaxID=192259 RepID=S8DHH7_9LAMI|nr:hypothetical protein M569_12503 [Genlisea aurea]
MAGLHTVILRQPVAPHSPNLNALQRFPLGNTLRAAKLSNLSLLLRGTDLQFPANRRQRLWLRFALPLIVAEVCLEVCTRKSNDGIGSFVAR